MDFWLGVIIGITGVYIYEQIKEARIKKNSPKRGRPPKKIEVKEEEK